VQLVPKGTRKEARKHWPIISDLQIWTYLDCVGFSFDVAKEANKGKHVSQIRNPTRYAPLMAECPDTFPSKPLRVLRTRPGM